MNTLRPVTRKLTVALVATLCCVVLSGCDYEVPITSGPTRKLDERLLGNWVSKDGKEKMKVRRLDDSVYIGSYDGDLFRAFHSDVAGTSFISAQNIDSAERKYAYLTYTVSADGNRLGLRDVNTKVIPTETEDSTSVQRLLENNLQNPALFNEEEQFTKEK
jgi:hypothetical protein